MANLNFQQPPRSIANSSLSNRGGSIGAAFGGAVNSGHVTPTSGMFQQNNAGFGPPSQLSPNRGGVQLGGVFNQIGGNSAGSTNQQARANLFGPRTMTDRRQMQNLGQMVRFSFLIIKMYIHIIELPKLRFLIIFRHRWDHLCRRGAMLVKTATLD